MNNEYEMITLDFEDGATVECEAMGIFEVEGNEYIAFLPVEEGEGVEEGDVYLYRYKEVSEEEFEIEDIESEEEFEKVAAEFDKIMSEEEAEE